jgi:hypothetical protein
LLVQLIGTGEPLRDYCIAWALGWCGDESAVPVLRGFLENTSTPEFVKRIAFDALAKLSDEPTQVELRSEKISQLPSDLRSLAQNGSSADFANALRTYLNSENPGHFAVLDTIHQIDNERVRLALIDILRTVPLSFNSFQSIRHIFKIAEYRRDGKVYGLLTYRFQKEPTKCRIDRWGNIYLPTGIRDKLSLCGSCQGDVRKGLKKNWSEPRCCSGKGATINLTLGFRCCLTISKS